MKIIKERRRGNYVFAVAMTVIFITCVIFVLKYYDLQARYVELLGKQSVEEHFKLR